MPTRCPRCNTLNQLPSLPSSSPPTKAASGERAPSPKASARQQRPSETCALCGQLIGADSERFADVHGTVYHRACYQKRAGDAPEGVCRICHQPFETLKDRVKDTVGFCYHRKCYREELERQKLAATGKPRGKAAGPITPSEQLRPAGKPTSEVDDWDLTEDDDDWDLTGEVDDDWMRPDPEELDVVETSKPSPLKPSPFTPLATPPPKKAAKQTPDEPTKSETPKPAAPAGSSSGPKTTPKAAPARPSKLREETKPSRPVPAPEKPAAKKPSRPALASEKPAAKKPTPSTPVSNKPVAKKPASPAPASNKPAAKKQALKKAKPLPRAKPLEQHPAAALMPEGLELLPEKPQAMPEGLELLPEKPQAMPEGLELLPETSQAMPDGLELLSDAPGNLPAGLEPLPDSPQPAGIDGLEILDDGPPAATAKVVSGSRGAVATPAAASLPAGLEPLDDLVPLDNRVPLSQGPGLSPLEAAGSMEPVQGVLLDPMTGTPSSLTPRRSGGNDSIPTWLWAVMGIGVGVVVIMLVASLVSMVSTNRQRNQELASSETVESGEESIGAGDDFVETNEPPWQTERSFEGEAEKSEDWPPPSSRSAGWQKFFSGLKRVSIAAWCAFLVFFGIVSGIWLAISALGLRLACAVCGENDASGKRIIAICFLLMVSTVLVSPVHLVLDPESAIVVGIFLTVLADAVLIRFILPTSNARAIGIGICHYVMNVIITYVGSRAVLYGIVWVLKGL